MPQITGFLVASGTSVTESACDMFICCIGRWLTLSSALKIRIRWQCCQNMSALEGWCATNRWLHNTSWHRSWGFERNYILPIHLFFCKVGFF